MQEKQAVSRLALAGKLISRPTLLVIAAAIFSSCSVAGPPSPSVKAVAVTAKLSREIKLLAGRDAGINSMRAQAVMEYNNAGRRLRFHENLIVRKPASLRIEVVSPVGVMTVIATNGSRLEIYDPSHDTLRRGDASARTLYRFTGIPLAPNDAASLLMGIAPDAGALGSSGRLVGSEDGMTVVAYGGGGVLREAGFADGQLMMVREQFATGQVGYEVHYGEYRDVGGISMPHRIDADFPLASSHLKIRYSTLKINTSPPQSVFAIHPGPSTKQIGLGNG